jgi:hypothetical protein
MQDDLSKDGLIMRRIGGATVVLAVVATFASYGCGSGEVRPTARVPIARPASLDAPGTTATTSAALTTSSVTPKTKANPKTSTASAVMRVSTERCDRAAACKQVGMGRVFGDRDECVNAVGHEVVTALSDEECPSGVDAEHLATCLSEVQASACDAPESVAHLLPSCTPDRLCRGEGPPAQTER